MTWYTQPFDRHPSRKDRDFVEQMDRAPEVNETVPKTN